jgi:hypothetical protein
VRGVQEDAMEREALLELERASNAAGLSAPRGVASTAEAGAGSDLAVATGILFGNVAGYVQRRGVRGLRVALEHEVVGRPMVALAAAACVGYLMGRRVRGTNGR